jgi:UPF0716 protein FxsA
VVALLLILLLVVAPLAELYVIIQVAHVIGGWETIALLLIESAIGAWLLRRQGLNTLARIGEAVDQRRIPGRELVDGLLIIIAGALMLAPGFISDIIGYLLLLPPTRAPIRGVVMRRFKSGKAGRFVAFSSGGARFVGDFRAGGVRDTTGHEGADPPRTELGP